MTQHSFTEYIIDILTSHFNEKAITILNSSDLLKYINTKTISATRGSKSRGSFANLYAIYVLIEDYLDKKFHTVNKGQYSKYEGAQFSIIFTRQRELPFGAKLQNHALNSRLNEEFHKYFPTSTNKPIIRDIETKRYWFNENLLEIEVAGDNFNIAEAIIQIIDKYVEIKQASLNKFLETCLQLQEANLENKNNTESVINFVESMLDVNADARIFEICSYSILKNYYKNQSIFWGYERDDLTEDSLSLYKTGRTNANDGGIDFVMKPLGRFFQVTEDLNFKKFFLDIDKIHRYPISFVVKSNNSGSEILDKIKNDAFNTYAIEKIIDKYMKSIEEIINIPTLLKYLKDIINNNEINNVLDELIIQSKVEFNFNE